MLGPESLGLSAPPTDLHLLADGRLLAVSPREIAFGDGVRWQVFRSADDKADLINETVAVGEDDRIYAGIEGHIARLDFGADARWHLVSTVALPENAGVNSAVLKQVVMLSNEWYWHGDTGAIVAWKPGQQTQIVGKVGAIEKVFGLGKEIFVSNYSEGALYRMDSAAQTMHRISPPDSLANETITCAVPFGPGLLLTGTINSGLQLFDGISGHPFKAGHLFGLGHRINDVCAIGDGLFAAAVDSVGIIFFDRDGRTVQVLDNGQDHRLARVKKIVYAPNGVLWAVLNEGLVRVEFPSPITKYEQMLSTAVDYAKPVRHEGRLWIVSDGRVLQGVYDEDGRLTRFEDSFVPGKNTSVLKEMNGELWAASNTGVYARDENGWKLVVAGIDCAHIDVARPRDSRIFYAAKGEIGWIHQSDEGCHAQRFAEPNLGEVYNGVEDDKGIVWLELGMSRIGRVDLSGDKPVLKILGSESGLTVGWVQLYLWAESPG